MSSQTITAMFQTRAEAEHAAEAVRHNTTFAGATARVLPETDVETTTTTTEHQHDTGFMATLRNFFMPEEDRYGYAEGIRRGSYMVAVETDQAHAHEVMDALEQAGAVDLDAQEAEWRREGWHGYQPTGTGTAGMAETPAAYGATETATGLGASGVGPATIGTPATATTTMRETDMPADVGRTGMTGTDSIHDASRETAHAAPYAPTAATGTEERIPLAEETLRVGKRQVVEGRVRIRSYVVETPVSEAVRLRDEHVQVERQPVDRAVEGVGDPFRERVFEATESREEAVVSKDTRIREELVMRRSATERDETVKDTVRRTEVEEDRGDAVTREPGTTRTP